MAREIKKQTLLDKAKAIPRKTHATKFEITDEVIELALAWVRNDVGIQSVAKVLGLKGTDGRAYAIMAMALREHLKSKE